MDQRIQKWCSTHVTYVQSMYVVKYVVIRRQRHVTSNQPSGTRTAKQKNGDSTGNQEGKKNQKKETY